MKFNNETLAEYCSQNKIKLTCDYADVKLNRDSFIKGGCIIETCCKTFYKKYRQIVKTGAYCEKCMSDVSRQKIKNALVKCDNNMLSQFCNENKITLIDDYTEQFVNNKTIIQGLCLQPGCENIFAKPFRQLIKINGYCEDCSKENGKAKIIETNLKRYGFECALNNNEVREKQKQTVMKKYGVTYISQIKEVKEKSKKTSLERYGVEYPLQCPEIRKQMVETNLKKYGCKSPSQNKEVQEKTFMTNLEKYGCKFSSSSEIVKEKIRQTNLERYGVEHHSQNGEVADRMLKSAYNKKPYKMPSGKIVEYQGYEHFALNELLFFEKMSEIDIVMNRKDVPEIWYIDNTGKKRRHYVDFYIPSQNRCIEVKSTWTNQEKNHVLEKQKAAKELGLYYEIWIYDKEGNKI